MINRIPTYSRLSIGIIFIPETRRILLESYFTTVALIPIVILNSLTQLEFSPELGLIIWGRQSRQTANCSNWRDSSNCQRHLLMQLVKSILWMIIRFRYKTEGLVPQRDAIHVLGHSFRSKALFGRDQDLIKSWRFEIAECRGRKEEEKDGDERERKKGREKEWMKE